MDPRVDDFIEIQREDLKELFNNTRRVLLAFEPILAETIKWNTPFYTHKGKNVCYLSSKSGKDFVQVAFLRGFDLDHPELVADGRNLVRALEFLAFSSEDETLLSLVVQDAISLAGG